MSGSVRGYGPGYPETKGDDDGYSVSVRSTGEKRVSIVEHAAGDLNGCVMALREEVAMLEDALRGFLRDNVELAVLGSKDESDDSDSGAPLARALDSTKDVVEQTRRTVRSLTQRL